MKALVMINPLAGRQVHEAVRGALDRYFTPAGVVFSVYEIHAGDVLREVVRMRQDAGFDYVIAAGGDGTVAAVIDGLYGSSLPLGIIPSGTGNLVARELGIPITVDAAVALIAGPHERRHVDTMRVGERVYALNISVGISADIIGGTTRANKTRFGRVAYYGAALPRLFKFRYRAMHVVIDGVERDCHAGEVAVLNCGLPIRGLYPKGPDVRVDDGRLDVWIVSRKTIFDYPRYLLGLLTGHPSPKLTHFVQAARSVSIRGKTPLPVQADGDLIGTTPVHVEIQPGALTVIVPREKTRSV